MHRSDHSQFRHSHNFVHDFTRGERRTRIVIAITGTMMVLEITVGLLSHSMALLADGWHMSTHVIAFLITAAAYYFTKRHASDLRFSFGTGKIGVLGGFASAVVLSVVALTFVAWRYALEGMQPQFKQTPPSRLSCSMSSTRLPLSAA